MPQATDSPVTISKGVDHFQFVVKHTAFDQHMDVAILDPIQQLHGKSGRIIRESTEVKNVSLLVHHTYRARTETTGFLSQSLGHNGMGIQQIIHGIRIQRIHHFVDLICVLDFCNILRRSDDPFAIQNGSDLLQAQSILFNCQRGIDGTDTISTAQHGIRCQIRYGIYLSNQFRNLSNFIKNGSCDLKGWFLVVHDMSPHTHYISSSLIYQP